MPCRVSHRFSPRCQPPRSPPSIGWQLPRISAFCWASPGGSRDGGKIRPRIIFWQAETWVGGSSAPRYSRRTSVPSTLWAWPVRRQGRRGDGALRASCLVLVGAGLGFRAVLRPIDGLYHAGIPGETLLAGLALCALDRFPDYLRSFEDRRGHFRRRGRVQHPAARGSSPDRQYGDRQLLDRIRVGDCAHRPLHDVGRHAGRGLQRCHPNRDSHLRIGHFDDLRPLQARRVVRTSLDLRLRDVQSLEAAHSGRHDRHVVAGD